MSGQQPKQPAIRVRQWLSAWDEVTFDPEQWQRKPEPHFYLVSMRARDLRALAGVNRRDASEKARSEDTGVQRRHDATRSAEIRRFVSDGYPLSGMSVGQRAQADESKLRRPGWLPSAVIVNILDPSDDREDVSLSSTDAVTIEDEDEISRLIYPESWTIDWKPIGTAPIEVIDGQHRLWAFEESDDHDFELPVVAFRNLDVSWQAYLFWSVNIKPKRINASLAFDLYPLLREQSWLQAGEGAWVYRETRAQELTEALWATPENPWFRRINMLGDTGMRLQQPVTQAAFVRSLANTFVRAWHGRTTVGGLFGGMGGRSEGAGLSWTRSQQAGFLVMMWRKLEEAVAETDASWADSLRQSTDPIELPTDVDMAFASPQSLLASDQGVRPAMHVFNDLFFVHADRLKLKSFGADVVDDILDVEVVEEHAELWSDSAVGAFAEAIATQLAEYDWRNSKATGLTDEERRTKLVFRGSGGYKELRRQLLDLLRDSPDEYVADAAESVFHRT